MKPCKFNWIAPTLVLLSMFLFSAYVNIDSQLEPVKYFKYEVKENYPNAIDEQSTLEIYVNQNSKLMCRTFELDQTIIETCILKRKDVDETWLLKNKGGLKGKIRLSSNIPDSMNYIDAVPKVDQIDKKEETIAGYPCQSYHLKFHSDASVKIWSTDKIVGYDELLYLKGHTGFPVKFDFSFFGDYKDYYSKFELVEVSDKTIDVEEKAIQYSEANFAALANPDNQLENSLRELFGTLFRPY